MLGLQELHNNISLLQNECLVSKGIFSPILSPYEANYVKVSCYNPAGENIVTCLDDRKPLFLSEVGGLSMDLSIQSRLELTQYYVPIFDYRTLDQAMNVNVEFVGICLSSLFKNCVKERAGIYVPNDLVYNDISKLTKLCGKKKVILFLTGSDVLIEWVWHKRDNCDFFHQLRYVNFWAVTGFNFSVFGGECPFAQALNQKRSLYSSYLAEKWNLNTIPHIYAINQFHIDRYQSWLASNPNVHLVTVNCQMQKTQADISQIIYVVSCLLNQNLSLHVLLQGFRIHEAVKFGSLLNRIHFADSKPVKYGQNYRFLDDHLNETDAGRGDYKNVVMKNLIIRNNEVKQIMIKN